MSLSLAQSIVEVRDVLNESAAIFWTDAQITKWLQEGTRVFSSKTLLVEDTQILDPPIANKIVYTATEEPTWMGDVLEVYAAIYDDGSQGYKGLIKIHPRQLGNLATRTAGPPKYYCFFNRSIYIWPLPSAAVITNGQISFLIAIETDDITAIADEYQHLPIMYSVAKCKQKDQKFGEASSLLAQFYQELQFERNDKHARETDSLDKFKIPAKGGGTDSANG
jgi:hypothetical protein